MHSVDNTGCFLGHAKTLSSKAFLNVNEDVVWEMAKIGTILTPSDGTIKAIEKFLCELYVPNTSLKTVKDLQRWLLCKNQGQSEPCHQHKVLYMPTAKPWCETMVLSQTLTYHLLKTMAGRKRTTAGFQWWLSYHQCLKPLFSSLSEHAQSSAQATNASVHALIQKMNLARIF